MSEGEGSWGNRLVRMFERAEPKGYRGIRGLPIYRDFGILPDHLTTLSRLMLEAINVLEDTEKKE